jgi:NAD(P)-dependent dehydrogenase (short-subunit alcohol dehydrogenase family)
MNPVALITGASRGIGRGIALALSRERRHEIVINFAENEAAAEECRGLCLEGGAPRAEIVRGDVSLRDDRARIIEFVAARFGRLDLLVNNAGITSPGRADILEATEESWEKVMGINLRGPFFPLSTCGKAYPGFNADRGNTSRYRQCLEHLGLRGFDEPGDYCITKAGIGMSTKLWAARLAEFGIGVFELQPGVIESDMTGPVKAKYDALFEKGFARSIAGVRRRMWDAR